MEGKPWYFALWQLADHSLRRWSERLQRVLRLLRLARFLLILGILAVLGSAAVGLWWPKYFFYAYAVAALFLVVPLALLAFLVALPLRARSIVRLIDRGYPANGRELFIRLLARKVRDESIATEELLFETAVNEGKKVLRRLRDERKASEPPSKPD
jgi:hypothetical protein